jgi:hypothetical protein
VSDISDLVGGRKYNNPRRPDTLYGRVVKAPAAYDDVMTVIAPYYSPDYQFEVPAGQWQPRSGGGPTLPVAGDTCLIVFDDRGDVWVPVWNH